MTKIKEILSNRKLMVVMALCIFIAGLLTSLGYIWIFERAEVNNDYTDTLLWAYESIVGRSLYNTDFYYAYMLPFGGSIVMYPFALLFGFTYKAHLLGMSTFAVLYSVMLYFFYKEVTESKETGLLMSGVTMVLFTCSEGMRLIFWGHVIQYSLGLGMTYIALIFIKKIYEKNIMNVKNGLIIALAIWTALCMTNGVNIVPFFFGPLVVALFLERMLDEKASFSDTKTRQSIFLMAVITIMGATGFVINVFSQRHLDKTYLENLFSYRNTSEWFYSLNGWLSTWCSMGADKVESGVKIMSTDGIITGIMYIFCLVILIIPIIECFFYKKMNNRIMKIQLISHHVLFIISILMLSVVFTANFNWRIGGAFASCIVTSLIFTSWLMKDAKYRRWGILLILFFAMCSLTVVARVSRLEKAYGSNKYDRIIDALRENGQVYGYGDVWDANAVTMLSNSEIKMRSIAFEDWNSGKYVIDRYQCEERWYADQENVSEYFVYVDSENYATCNEGLKEAAKEIVPFEDGAGYILIFDGNIFADGEGIYNIVE